MSDSKTAQETVVAYMCRDLVRTVEKCVIEGNAKAFNEFNLSFPAFKEGIYKGTNFMFRGKEEFQVQELPDDIKNLIAQVEEHLQGEFFLVWYFMVNTAPIDQQIGLDYTTTVKGCRTEEEPYIRFTSEDKGLVDNIQEFLRTRNFEEFALDLPGAPP